MKDRLDGGSRLKTRRSLKRLLTQERNEYFDYDDYDSSGARNCKDKLNGEM